MKKFSFLLVVISLFAVANAADWTKSGYQKVDGVKGYYFIGIPEGDSMKIGAGDTLTTVIGAAGTNAKWVDLGVCPSDPADSGNISLVVMDSTTNAAHASVNVACSLFVTLHPFKGSSYPKFLYHIGSSLSNNTGTIITDSLTSKTAGCYQIPSLKGKEGYRILVKLYTYAGSRAAKLKTIFLKREKP